MDDPWGSPWADESTRPLPKFDKLSSKRPVRPEKPLGVSQDSRSPWDDDDDDGFGEWTTLPATDEIQANVQDGPEQAEIVGWSASVNEEFTQGKDHIRPDGSAWFSREMQPKNGGSLGVEIPQVSDRALSPDPWAQEAAGAEEKARSPQVADSNAGEESTKNNTGEDGARVGTATAGNEDEYGTQASGELDRSVPLNGEEETSIGKPAVKHHQDRPTAVLDHADASMQAEEATQGESLASRPSSSPSDHSHHNEVLTESPRTSFEEAEERPKLEREGSSKVKEMVRLFDSLAVDEGTTELPSRPRGLDAPDNQFDTPLAAQSEDDFGDFEEGISYATTKADPAEDASTKLEEKFLDKDDVHGLSALPASTEEPMINPSDQPLKPHDLVHFEPDLLLLSQIFGQTPDAEFVYADPKQAPEIDTVIRDSFSSTEERKTWYRISRYGTMRKHNAIDEDNYVRINWKDSTVRAETLKIVERWIEEDRIGGGFILGGGTKLGSMFGWGQKNAAPISVAAALESRSGKAAVHSDRIASPTPIRNSDVSPVLGSSSNRRSLEHISSSRNSFQSPLSAIAPHFSWSTGTPMSTTAEATLAVLPPPVSPNNSRQAFGNLSSPPKVIKDSSWRSPLASGGPLAISKPSSVQLPKLAAGNATNLGKHSTNERVPKPPENESRPQVDDDWGEMISSPALENPPPVKESSEVQPNLGVMEVLIPSLATNPPATDSDRTSGKLFNERMISPQSDGGIFIPPGFADHLKLEPTSPTAAKSDVWATADFSFFDSPALSKPTPAAPTPVPKASIQSPVPVKQSQGSSREQVEQDRVVESIVQNLPDLSYMLRR